MTYLEEAGPIKPKPNDPIFIFINDTQVYYFRLVMLHNMLHTFVGSNLVILYNTLET